MKLLLKEFQAEAVQNLAKKLRSAAKDAKTGDLQSVSLVSPTGSGKTVMVTALIEQLLTGDDDSPPMPDATVLWVTDQPEINEHELRSWYMVFAICTRGDFGSMGFLPPNLPLARAALRVTRSTR